jgi:hypothetical protein
LGGDWKWGSVKSLCIADFLQFPAWAEMRSGEILGGSCFGQRPFKGKLSKSESVNMTEFIGGRLPAVLNVNAILRHIANIQIFQAGLRGEYVRAQLSFGGYFGSFYKIAGRLIQSSRSDATTTVNAATKNVPTATISSR